MPAAALTWTYRVFTIRHRGRKRDVEVYSPASSASARFAAGKADDEEVSEKRLDAFDQRFRVFTAKKSASISELEKFYSGMAESLHVGADFRTALDLVAPSAETPYFRGVIAALYERKASSASIAALMKEFPGAFTNVAVAMVDQGETSGKLEIVFDKLASMTKDRMAIIGEIKSGLYYPGFIGCLLLIAIIVINFLVLPMITKNFKLFNTELPPVTQALFDALTFVSTHPQVAFIPPILVIFAFIRRRWLIALPISQKALVRLPKLGGLFQKEILSRSLRTLAMLYQSGVYQRDAFAITAKVADHVEYTAYFLAISQHLSKSASLYQAFLRERHRIGKIGKAVADQMKVASATADPSAILARIAALFEEQAMRDAKNLPKLIEPLLILVILVFVGFLAAAIYLPNLYLMSHVAQHPNLMVPHHAGPIPPPR